MIVFVCAGCGAELTAPLSQVALPAHAHQKYGNGVQLPVLMEPGTFAVESESESWRPSWPSWEKGAPDAADGPSIHASADGLLSGDAADSSVIAPGDTRGTVLIPEKSGGYCCGLDGADGPNMACEVCGLPVASRIDDCSLWQAVWLAPNAVRRHAIGDTSPAPLPWADLTTGAMGTPPYEPITSWGGRHFGLYHWWSWSPRWEAAAGRGLAHLLAASGGRPVSVPHGLTAEVFQRALDALLSADGPPLHAALAGPHLPAPDTDADLLLVPEHPQTGRPGPRPEAPWRTWFRCRSVCGCGWPSPSRTCPQTRRHRYCPPNSSGTTRLRLAPVTCSESTRESSGTPCCGCRLPVTRGCARSLRTCRRTRAPASSEHVAGADGRSRTGQPPSPSPAGRIITP